MAAVFSFLRLAIASIMTYAGFVDRDGATSFQDRDGATQFVDRDGTVG